MELKKTELAKMLIALKLYTDVSAFGLEPLSTLKYCDNSMYFVHHNQN